MKRVLSIIVVFLLVLCGLGFLSMNWLLHNMKGQIESALGEGAHVESIQINWPTIQITELRIDAPKNWPSKETLRAKRIVIEPDLRSLFSKTIRVHQIIAEEAYLSIIRMPQGGIKLLPSLLDKPTKSDVQKEQGTSSADEGNSAYSLIIGSVDLKNSSIDFFDQTLRKKAHRITVSQLNGSVSQIDLPKRQLRSEFNFVGNVNSVLKKQSGQINLLGWMQLSTRDGRIKLNLKGFDLLHFQPYLIKTPAIASMTGDFDMDLDASIKDQKLHAPGRLNLHHLGVHEKTTSFGTIPRAAMVGLLKDHAGDISVSFTLSGRLDDPQFSLNEDIAKKIGLALTKSLGISFEELPQNIGQMSTSSVQKVREKAHNFFQNLFGK